MIRLNFVILLLVFARMYITAQCSIIEVVVIHDRNCNGAEDTNDQTLANWPVKGDYLTTKSTNQDGRVFYDHLNGGTYDVHLLSQNGYVIKGRAEREVRVEDNDIKSIKYYVCSECIPNFRVSEHHNFDGCCLESVTAKIVGNYPILSATWSDGYGGASRLLNRSGSYSINIEYDCHGERRRTQLGYKLNLPKGKIPDVDWISNTVTPNQPQIFIDSRLELGQTGAYNANEYNLYIFDRWGAIVYHGKHKSCVGVKNGDIRWDGRDKKGRKLKEGMYLWKLTLASCEHPCRRGLRIWNGIHCKGQTWQGKVFLLNE